MSSPAPPYSPIIPQSPFTDQEDTFSEGPYGVIQDCKDLSSEEGDEYSTKESFLEFDATANLGRRTRTVRLICLAFVSLVVLLCIIEGHPTGALARYETRSSVADQCEVLTPAARAHIDSLKPTPTGALAATFNGALISDTTHIPYPGHICLYAVVAANPDYPVREIAPDYWRQIGPDGLHWQLTSDSAHIQLETPNIANLVPITYLKYTDSPQHAHVYAQPVTIRETGVWIASAETALVSWDWLRENPDGKDVYEYQNKPLQSVTFTVDPPTQLVQKPVCDASLGKTMDSSGIWRINDTDPTRPHIADDFWGMSFQHSQCQQPYYDQSAIRQCLANKQLRFYGDSNVRRVSKMLQSEGTWCSMDHKYDVCQSEDIHEQLFPDGTEIGWAFSTGCQNPPLSLLDNTTIHFAFTGGLAAHPDCSVMADLASVAKRRLGLDQPPFLPEDERDVVYISSLSWELAFTPLDGYVERLAELHRLIDLAYPNSKILLREATTICCRAALKGSAGIKRTVLFNSLLQKEFANTDDRYHIIPVSALDGRRFSHNSEDMPILWSNHLRATEVSQEVQMVAHAICGP